MNTPNPIPVNTLEQSFREYLHAFQRKMKWEFGNYIEHREKLLKEEPQEFHDEINKQFYEEIANHIAVELAENFSESNPEQIAIFLETFNIQRWLDK